MPDDFPVFLPHAKVLEYLKLYAEKFALLKYIRFHTEVVKVMKSDDFANTGRWRVEFKEARTGECIIKVRTYYSPNVN